MMRLQPSWILESASEQTTVESIFFPFIHRCSSLTWFTRRDLALTINTPVDSQALLLRAWFGGENKGFSEKNFSKFNQVIRRPLELDLNPFRGWHEKLFDRSQLDYLFYWREAAYEIENLSQREIFWAAVYSIMSYWLANRKVSRSPGFAPDEIMGRVLKFHQEIVGGCECDLQLCNSAIEEFSPPEVSLMVFPLVFNDEEDGETHLQTIFHAWLHGHADIDQARREIKNHLRGYSFSLENKADFQTYVKLAQNADSVAVCWSGEELPPRVHEQEIIAPFKTEFAGTFSRSKFSIKTVDGRCDSYDYLLLFFR